VRPGLPGVDLEGTGRGRAHGQSFWAPANGGGTCADGALAYRRCQSRRVGCSAGSRPGQRPNPAAERPETATRSMPLPPALLIGRMSVRKRIYIGFYRALIWPPFCRPCRNRRRRRPSCRQSRSRPATLSREGLSCYSIAHVATSERGRTRFSRPSVVTAFSHAAVRPLICALGASSGESR
jgi:hypothetical protein